MNCESSSRIPILVRSLLGLWLATVVFAAYIGVFGAGTRYSMNVPLPLGLAVLAPMLVFAFWFRLSPRFREYAYSLNPVLLAMLHVERVGGIVFLILMSKNLLPATFALPAGIGDIAIGLTAPLAAWQLSKQRRYTRGIILWNVLGIADLVIAVTTGILSSNSQLGILVQGSVTTRLMGQLPMSLVPTFLVPLLVILHLISLIQANRERSRQTEAVDVIATQRVA
jgi:hypothetical protein